MSTIHLHAVFRQWSDRVLPALGENSSPQLIPEPPAEIRSPTPGTDTSCPSLMDGSVVRPAFRVWWKHRGGGRVLGPLAGCARQQARERETPARRHRRQMGMDLHCIGQMQAGARACHPGVDRTGQRLSRELLPRVEDKSQPLMFRGLAPCGCSKTASCGGWGEAGEQGEGPGFPGSFFQFITSYSRSPSIFQRNLSKTIHSSYTLSK